MSTLTRKNVSLHTSEIQIVSRVRHEGTPEHDALREVSGHELSPSASEAESLRAILKVGLQVIEERVLTNGYAALAASQTADDRAATAAIRRRAAAYTD